MNNKETFCEDCRKDVSFCTEQNTIVQSFKGDDIEFTGTVAKCSECENSVFIPEFMDANLKALYEAYRIKNGFLSLERICEIPIKYAIGKRPLSLLLGWGEVTFTRYCDGDVPSKQYDDILQLIYNEPVYFLSVLEDNKDTIKPAAYKKARMPYKSF
jgi:putative zinc finger/helix-turn-helix YgiT family protein